MVQNYFQYFKDVIFQEYYDIASSLIDCGVDVNHKNFNDATTLIYAATFGQKEIIKLLV